ncbi:MAG: prolyl hydroxylase family protein [Oligoflexales bacterium]
MASYIKRWPKQVSASFCKHLIERFEDDNRVQDDPQPDYSARSFLLISDLPEWRKECQKLNSIVNQNAARYFSLPKKYRSITQTQWSHDGFLIARYLPGEACILHVDGQCSAPPQNQLRLATFLLYLNTLEQGGETVFPFQDVQLQPEAGSVVLFPPMHTHPHEVLAAKEPRYILQTWITDPAYYIVDHHQYKAHQNKKKIRRKN